MGSWEAEEASWAFVCSSEVLEAGFLGCSRLVCWFGWEGADESIVGEGAAMSLVVVRRIWGLWWVKGWRRLAKDVSAGNDDQRPMIETQSCRIFVL
jgi:hypothetical protein